MIGLDLCAFHIVKFSALRLATQTAELLSLEPQFAFISLRVEKKKRKLTVISKRVAMHMAIWCDLCPMNFTDKAVGQSVRQSSFRRQLSE